jgi:hypothetical protein
MSNVNVLPTDIILLYLVIICKKIYIHVTSVSFTQTIFVSGHFEPVIEPTNADAPDTQQV